MLIHFSYNLSVFIIGNGTVNAYKYYSSKLTYRIIIPAAFTIANSTATDAGIIVSATTASAASYTSSFLFHKHNNI
jgi:hypothetical protein